MLEQPDERLVVVDQKQARTPILAARGQPLPEHGLQDLDDLRIELVAGEVHQLVQRLVRRFGRAVGARRRHRDVGVDDGENPRAERDLPSTQAVRVTVAVVTLVVVLHDRQHAPGILDVIDQPHGRRDVLAHRRRLVVAQLAFGFEDGLGQPGATDVPQQCAEAQFGHGAPVLDHLVADRLRQVGDLAGVSAEVPVVELEQADQHVDRAQQRFVAERLEAGDAVPLVRAPPVAHHRRELVMLQDQVILAVLEHVGRHQHPTEVREDEHLGPGPAFEDLAAELGRRRIGDLSVEQGDIDADRVAQPQRLAAAAAHRDLPALTPERVPQLLAHLDVSRDDQDVLFHDAPRPPPRGPKSATSGQGRI